MAHQPIINTILNGEIFEIFPRNSGTPKSDPSPLLNIILASVANTLRKGWMDEGVDERKTNIRKKRPTS